MFTLYKEPTQKALKLHRINGIVTIIASLAYLTLLLNGQEVVQLASIAPYATIVLIPCALITPFSVFCAYNQYTGDIQKHHAGKYLLPMLFNFFNSMIAMALYMSTMFVNIQSANPIKIMTILLLATMVALMTYHALEKHASPTLKGPWTRMRVQYLKDSIRKKFTAYRNIAQSVDPFEEEVYEQAMKDQHTNYLEAVLDRFEKLHQRTFQDNKLKATAVTEETLKILSEG